MTRQDIHLYLDNLIDNLAMERTDMSSERRRVIIAYNDDGSPVYKNLKASSQEEMNVKIVKTFIESGRINELMACRNSALENNKIRLSDYAKDWLERKRKLKETTRANYKKYLDDYIIPSLGNLNIQDIKPKDIQKMLDSYKNLSHKTLKDAKGILSQIFKYAINDELITKNPCCDVDIDIPSNKVTEREALPVDIYRQIIENLQMCNQQDRTFILLVMLTAMRRGEVLGLQWRDVHDNYIFVSKNVTHPQQNQPIVTTPKTKAGIRQIPLDPILSVNLIKPSSAKDSDYIIGGAKPLTLSAYRNMWERINKTIDMHGATPHILRHSYLTYAVGQTTDFKTIQGISGHADLNTLLNRYAHVQKEKVEELSNKMHNILS